MVRKKGFKHSEETKRKIGLANSISLKGKKPKSSFKKGHIPYNKGKKISYNPHYKQRGKIPHNKGIDNRTKYKCLKCGKVIYSYQQRKYCSHSCSHKNRKLSEEHKRKIGISNKGNTNGRFGKGKIISKKQRKQSSNTLKKMYKQHPEKKEFLRQKRYEQKRVFESKPEKIFQQILKASNIKFKKHQYIKIKHPYQCDIFIEPNIVIEIDGDYWHNLPENKKKDKVRNKEMKEKGLKVFRIKTSKFLDRYYKLNKNNADKILLQIKNATK